MPQQLEIERKRQGGGFAYRVQGRPVRDPKIIDRIKGLALPPAWKDVRIAKSASSKLQATGFDIKGRKQYRYHQDFSHKRNLNKFQHLADFARRLPEIRRRLKRDLRSRNFSKRKVLAGLVDILQRTNIRIGNGIYTKTNGSFGLTTLRNSHAKVKGAHVEFDFRAKSGKMRHVEFDDKALSRIVAKCQKLPGHELFCYLDADGKSHDVTSNDVNAYIKEISGGDFTAKDFRTWCGSIHAVQMLCSEDRVSGLSEREWRKRHLKIIRGTAEHLGNTPAICEKYYIHPRIFAADLRGINFCRTRRAKDGLSGVEWLALKLIEMQ